MASEFDIRSVFGLIIAFAGIIAAFVIFGMMFHGLEFDSLSYEDLVETEGYSVIVDGVEVSALPDNVYSSAYNVSVIDEDRLIICTTRSGSSSRTQLWIPMAIGGLTYGMSVG